MNNLKNKKFLDYKERYRTNIEANLRKDILEELIIKRYTSVCNNEREYIISQADFELYYGYELNNISIDSEKLIKVYNGLETADDLYVIEGVLYNEDEDVIDLSINDLIDKLITLVLDKGFTSPTNRSICKVYSYFLDDFFKNTDEFIQEF